MKKIALALVVCVVLAGCAKNPKNAENKHEGPKPSESLLTTADMHDCEQQLGLAQPKTSADVYVMSEDSIAKVKDCAFEREKQRMPLLADFIDQYRSMLQQGNQECLKDIGTHYAASCLEKSVNGAKEWYNLAVSQRLLTSGISSQPDAQLPKP